MMQPRLSLRETAAYPLPGTICQIFYAKTLQSELRTIRRGQFGTSSNS